MSIYLLKPRFQSLLRPAVRRLHGAGVTANQVTLAACAVSVLLGGALYLQPHAAAFALLPLWMLLRMALNAVDGMLAREFGQASKLGALLNEITDVVADTMLVLPFAAVLPFDPFWVGAVIVLAALSEFAGVLGSTIGASRRYDGPMGKSDRAFVFGALGLAVALDALPGAVALALPAVAVLTACTVLRRLKNALTEVQPFPVKP
jgi:CDP-diacylglycerol---glycerol-3-phosphate 3-phosphatidyltransferase